MLLNEQDLSPFRALRICKLVCGVLTAFYRYDFQTNVAIKIDMLQRLNDILIAATGVCNFSRETFLVVIVQKGNHAGYLFDRSYPDLWLSVLADQIMNEFRTVRAIFFLKHILEVFKKVFYRKKR